MIIMINMTVDHNHDQQSFSVDYSPQHKHHGRRKDNQIMNENL